jgi:hypothetical protein
MEDDTARYAVALICGGGEGGCNSSLHTALIVLANVLISDSSDCEESARAAVIPSLALSKQFLKIVLALLRVLLMRTTGGSLGRVLAASAAAEASSGGERKEAEASGQKQLRIVAEEEAALQYSCLVIFESSLAQMRFGSPCMADPDCVSGKKRKREDTFPTDGLLQWVLAEARMIRPHGHQHSISGMVSALSCSAAAKGGTGAATSARRIAAFLGRT